MILAIRSEVRKARLTRSLWALPAVGVAVAAVGCVLLVSIGQRSEIAHRLSEYGPLRFGPTNFGLLLLIFGVRLFCDETQHRTLSSTFIRIPNRGAVTAAKCLVAAAVAVGFCVAADVVSVTVTAIGVSARDLPMRFDVADSALMMGRVALAMALLGVLGVALGASFRNRSVAMVATILWFALGESLVGALTHASRYLPSAAVAGVVSDTDTAAHFAAGTSALLLVGYVAASAAAAYVTLPRDL